jgi:serine/threonine-protein kinase RsbT
MEAIHLTYEIDGDDFTGAGEASAAMKQVLKRLGIDSETIRRCAICMYEGEINTVIHADGGRADIYINADSIRIELSDTGPGIEDIGLAMQEGFSMASQNVRELGFGAGMGLPNMKRYSDNIEVDTCVGKGTKVIMTIRLPSN